MSNPVATAAALIAELSPLLARVWVARPFNRSTVVAALFEKMVADAHPDAYRVRVVLNRALDALAAERAAAIEAQA